jgi:hypothetical protein
MRAPVRLIFPLLLLITIAPAAATQFVVVDARGAGLKPGMAIKGESVIDLKEGERVTAIAPDGRSVSLRGTYHGPVMRAGTALQNPQAALAALISTRNDRAKSVGAIRAGANAAPLPDPWLVDISRPGPRCVREGDRPVWWRPDASASQPFKVFPIDRSWRADFVWKAGTDHMEAPALSKLDGVSTFLIEVEGQENAISLQVIPRDVTDPMILSSWMLERACVQQVDAYLRRIEAGMLKPPAIASGPTKATANLHQRPAPQADQGPTS